MAWKGVVSPELSGLLKEAAPESNINEGHNDSELLQFNVTMHAQIQA